MKRSAPGLCPVCQSKVRVTALKYNDCQKEIGGDFTQCRFCGLDTEQMEFVTAFLCCKGSIKEMEKISPN